MSEPDSQAPSKRRGRIARIVGAVVLIVTVLGVISAAIVPGYLARQTLVDILTKLHVRHEGVETIDVDLLRASAIAGPVTFGPEAEPFDLEHISVSASVAQVLNRRVRVTNVQVAGLETEVHRKRSGDLGVIGVTIKQLLEAFAGGNSSSSEGSTDTDESSGEPWGLGVDSLLVRDSRLLLRDLNGGELELKLELFEMSALQTWSENTPTRFRIVGSINEMAFEYDGEIKPFADPVAININGQIRRLTYASIARLAPEADDQPIDGVISADLSHDIVFHSSGRVDGTTRGQVVLDGFGVATPEGDDVQVSSARLDLDIAHLIPESGKPELKGKLEFATGQAEVRTRQGERVTLGGIIISGDSMDIRDSSDAGTPQFFSSIGDRLSSSGDGEAASLVDLIVRVALAIAEEVLSREQQIAGNPSVAVEGLTIGIPGEAGAEVLQAQADRIAVAAKDVAAEILSDGWRFDAALSAEIARYESQATVEGITVSSEVDSLTLATKKAGVTAEGDKTSVDLDFDLDIAGIRNTGKSGESLSLGHLSLATPGYRVVGTRDLTGDVSGALILDISDVAGVWPAADGNFSVNGEALQIRLGTAEASRGQASSITGSGTIDLSGWSFAQAGTPLKAALNALQIRLPASNVAFSEGGVKISPGAEAASEDQGSAGSTGDAASSPETEHAAPEEAPMPLVRPDSGIDQQVVAETTETEAPERQPTSDTPDPEVVAEVVKEAEISAPEKAPLPDARPEEIVAADAQPIEEEDKADPMHPGRFAVRIQGLDATVPSQTGVLAVSGEALDLALSSFDVSLDDGQRGSLAGHVAIAGLRVTDDGSGISGSLSTARLDAGGLDLNASGGAPGISGRLALSIEGLAGIAPAPTGGPVELSAEAIRTDLEILSVTDAGIALAGDVELAGASITETGEAPHRVAVRSLTLENGAVGERGDISADALRIGGLDLELTERVLTAAMGSSPPPAPEQLPGSDTQPDLPLLRFGELAIDGRSRVLLTDLVDGEPVYLQVGLETVRFGPLNLQDPSIASSFELAVSVNDLTRLNAGGTIRPLLSPPDADVAINLVNLPVAPFSPYIEEQLGLVLLGGFVSSDLKGQTSGGALNALLEVGLREFYLEPMSREANRAFRSKFVVSPNYAVGLLRDHKGNIDLSFPVSGTIEDPDIDLSALTETAVTGVLTSLVPFAWFDDDLETREVQVAFTPGSAEIPAAYSEFFDAAGERLMADQERVVLLCAVATYADVMHVSGLEAHDPPEQRPTTRDDVADALEIAVARETAVRERLAASHGVPIDRLGQCQTTYDEDTGLPPRVVFKVEVEESKFGIETTDQDQDQDD